MPKGIKASGGVGIGKVFIFEQVLPKYSKRRIKNTKAEIERYKDAVQSYIQKTQDLIEQKTNSAAKSESEILSSHIAIANDPCMAEEAEKIILGGQCAEAAVETVCDMFGTIFLSVDDELTNRRAADMEDVKTALLCELLDIAMPDIHNLPKDTVVVADELLPSATAAFNKENIVGIITQKGGYTSHSAIMSREFGIPAVLSVENALKELKNGDTVIVDGTNGVVIANPDKSTLSEYIEKQQEFICEKAELESYIDKKTMTSDGEVKCLECNIGKPEDLCSVLDYNIDGVGLFRTELLFMNKSQMPDEDEQFNAYKRAALSLKGKPVVIRTLDIGGDKPLPYVKLQKEDNPFLGFRAIRLCLKEKELYRQQLRAILRASAYGNIRIMVPLISCAEELREVKSLVEEIKIELRSKSINFDENIQIGITVETPAASIIADVLAKESDFFSIGTNDLVQYTMAVDRGNPKVAYLYSPYNPAVLRSVKHITECGKKEGINVGMCGEAAADPLLTPLLLSFGLDEFSVNTSAVLKTRRSILLWSKSEADIVAEKAMSLTTEKEVEQYLKSVAR